MAVLLLVSGCGGGDGNEPAPPTMLEGNDATQAAILVAQSTIAFLVGLRSNDVLVSDATGCSSGSVDASCRVDQPHSIVRASFNDCSVPLSSGGAAIADGGLRILVNDTGLACLNGQISPAAGLEFEYDGYTERLTGNGGDELGETRLNGRSTLNRGDDGCGGRDAVSGASVTVDTRVAARIPGQLLTDGTDMHVETEDLASEQTSVGTPCERRINAVSGRMEVEDHANGIRYGQIVDELTVAFVESGGLAAVRIDGNIDNDCLGRVVLTTPEPLVMRNATDCPTGGALRITIDGRVSEARFSNGGFSLDYGADGTVEVTGSDCRSVTQCAS